MKLYGIVLLKLVWYKKLEFMSVKQLYTRKPVRAQKQIEL